MGVVSQYRVEFETGLSSREHCTVTDLIEFLFISSFLCFVREYGLICDIVKVFEKMMPRNVFGRQFEEKYDEGRGNLIIIIIIS
jgi:hypothetical protein